MFFVFDRQISQEDKNWEQNIQELQKKVGFHISPQTDSSPTVTVLHQCYLNNEAGLVFETSLETNTISCMIKRLSPHLHRVYFFLLHSTE